MSPKMELYTNSGPVAMIGIGALFTFLWFAFHYPSIWIGVFGILLVIGGAFIASRK
ncbi:MAG: hypothetical protein M1166_07665 [Candidatus Thermoplasmatota archaeon]|nr:hypothetical protein [Candidatus Thermoplasmatota archaeon]